jgi:uncharacterized protein (TIGR02246 family)
MSQDKFARETARPGEVSLKFAKALSAGELEVAAALFAEGALFRTAEGPLLRGREAIRELLASLIEADVEMTVSLGTVLETADVAVASEEWTMNMTDPDGVGQEVSGRSTVVFGRAARGWEIAIDSPWGL